MTDFNPGDRVRVYAPHQRGEGVVRYAVVASDRVRVKLDGQPGSKLFQAKHLRHAERVPRSPGELAAAPDYSQHESSAPLDKGAPARAPEYLAWLRKQPCAWTGLTHSIEASHHPEQGHGRMGKKTCDLRALPLSGSVHRRYHETGEIGSMSAEQTRQWVEVQINRHLVRYMTSVLGVAS